MEFREIETGNKVNVVKMDGTTESVMRIEALGFIWERTIQGAGRMIGGLIRHHTTMEYSISIGDILVTYPDGTWDIFEDEEFDSRFISSEDYSILVIDEEIDKVLRKIEGYKTFMDVVFDILDDANDDADEASIRLETLCELREKL